MAELARPAHGTAAFGKRVRYPAPGQRDLRAGAEIFMAGVEFADRAARTRGIRRRIQSVDPRKKLAAVYRGPGVRQSMVVPATDRKLRRFRHCWFLAGTGAKDER